MDTINQSKEKLCRLLKLIDFSDGFTFLNIREEIGDVVVKNIEVVCDDKTILYHLPKEDALKFDVK